MTIKDTITAVEMYYAKVELDTEDIDRLYGGISRNSIYRLKKAAQAEQLKQGVMTFSNRTVNTECAFKAWGIDIDSIERKAMRLKKIRGEKI